MALETWKLVVGNADVIPWVPDLTYAMPIQDNANADLVLQDFHVICACQIIMDSPVKDAKHATVINMDQHKLNVTDDMGNVIAEP